MNDAISMQQERKKRTENGWKEVKEDRREEERPEGKKEFHFISQRDKQTLR